MKILSEDLREIFFFGRSQKRFSLWEGKIFFYRIIITAKILKINSLKKVLHKQKMAENIPKNNVWIRIKEFEVIFEYSLLHNVI